MNSWADGVGYQFMTLRHTSAWHYSGRFCAEGCNGQYTWSQKLCEIVFKICGTTSTFRTLIDRLCLPRAWHDRGTVSGLCAFRLYLGDLLCQLNTGGCTRKKGPCWKRIQDLPRTFSNPSPFHLQGAPSFSPNVTSLPKSSQTPSDNLPPPCFHHPGHNHLRLCRWTSVFPPSLRF